MCLRVWSIIFFPISICEGKGVFGALIVLFWVFLCVCVLFCFGLFYSDLKRNRANPTLLWFPSDRLQPSLTRRHSQPCSALFNCLLLSLVPSILVNLSHVRRSPPSATGDASNRELGLTLALCALSHSRKRNLPEAY